MGVKDGKTADLAIHLRGSHLALGDVTPRPFPAVLFDGRKTLVSGDGSGREQLARWLTATDHPLTSRVLVNRVWHWHFGRGLVPSTDNLGLLGERPTHPALLDWLAGTFVREGWSLKRLHRRLLESAAYQRSGETPVTERDRDPENRWLARFTPRRLSAEEIRDAILTVSNGLDPRPGGPALAIENRKHIFDHTSKDDTQYASQQRSVYLPIVRNHLCDVFTLFDYADDSVSTSARTSSTVASQALFLLNGELTLDAADRIANRVQQISSDDEQRIAHLYRQVLGRPPQPRETTRGRQFVAQIINGSEANAAAPERAPREQQAWRLLAQTLLISNEMLYVR
jgi:hypothetical protein